MKKLFLSPALISCPHFPVSQRTLKSLDEVHPRVSSIQSMRPTSHVPSGSLWVRRHKPVRIYRISDMTSSINYGPRNRWPCSVNWRDFICRKPCVFSMRRAIIDGFDVQGVTSCRATRWRGDYWEKSFPGRDHESALLRRSRTDGCLDSIPPNGPCPEIRL